MGNDLASFIPPVNAVTGAIELEPACARYGSVKQPPGGIRRAKSKHQKARDATVGSTSLVGGSLFQLKYLLLRRAQKNRTSLFGVNIRWNWYIYA